MNGSRLLDFVYMDRWIGSGGMGEIYTTIEIDFRCQQNTQVAM